MTALRNTRTFTIPQARQADEQRLREIAFAAKAGWGYDRQRVARWADTLRLCDQATAAAETFVYETNGKPVAWMRLIPREHTCILEDLWVEPALHRHGIGSRTRHQTNGAAFSRSWLSPFPDRQRRSYVSDN